MAGKNIAVYGIYSTRNGVEVAVDSLRAEGFRNTDISILFPENEGTKDFAHVKATKGPEGAVAGASTGALVGGALGWLVGFGSLPRWRAPFRRLGLGPGREAAGRADRYACLAWEKCYQN